VTGVGRRHRSYRKRCALAGQSRLVPIERLRPRAGLADGHRRAGRGCVPQRHRPAPDPLPRSRGARALQGCRARRIGSDVALGPYLQALRAARAVRCPLHRESQPGRLEPRTVSARVFEPRWLRALALATAGAVAPFGSVGLVLAVAGVYRPLLVFPLGAIAWVGLLLLARPILTAP